MEASAGKRESNFVGIKNGLQLREVMFTVKRKVRTLSIQSYLSSLILLHVSSVCYCKYDSWILHILFYHWIIYISLCSTPNSPGDIGGGQSGSLNISSVTITLGKRREYKNDETSISCFIINDSSKEIKCYPTVYFQVL